MSKFKIFLQADSKDCGPTCLKMIANHYGKLVDIQKLRDLSETTREGSNLLTLSAAAEKIGFSAAGVKLGLDKLEEAQLPCILHWNDNHYVVLYKISRGLYHIADPAHGLMRYSKNEFVKFWTGKEPNESLNGVALLLEKSPEFNRLELNGDDSGTYGFKLIFRYLIPYRSFMFQLFLGLFVGSVLQLLVPFLTQSIVDVGIRNRNIKFIYLVLFAQLFLFLGRTALEVIRGWILLHISVRINITLVSDFFIKLMSLPISFFDVRMTGDIMQRINDHQRIEKILTTSSLSVLFSVFNMFVMGGVLAYYNFKIFLVFFIGSAFYFLWIIVFLKKRADLDYKKFSEVSHEQSKVIELINGMQEIKLHNAEKKKRWMWEDVQVRLFKVSIKSLLLEQIQSVGSNSINEFKNILIIFLSAKLVIDGQITLGMMIAISSIVGNLNAPILQLIEFVREAQDAKISLARLSEIHNKEDEIQEERSQTSKIPENADIIIKDLSFRYRGTDSLVLKDLNLIIKANKITAIVGSSGSGKTTLMKLLLKFYEPSKGHIDVNDMPLKAIAQTAWRNHLGCVMQEGYIFNDTIANNIAIGDEAVDKNRLIYASDVANIGEFVENYPFGFDTKIGMEGIGMSTGQKQRMLIARAVYKNPEMLLFDEATSSLDANNEKEIMEKLGVFFENRTVVVIAHRLSTVMNADQIVVLEKGEIVEIGTHEELVSLKGYYFKLIKNQLQLGS
ncbi:peptidase domain-containing ABC transporter [Flavobacterium qiangtangense]|uniref:Peptidase domain-containing ABC transporter n=1 Tax=Flavobacterium qiangtangense TaxID=1442595 RepID=A0ABW1PLJ9_9FLAO